MPLETTTYLCLYTNGNYIGKFKTMDQVLDYIRKEAENKYDPIHYVNLKNYTVLSSISINAINTNKE